MIAFPKDFKFPEEKPVFLSSDLQLNNLEERIEEIKEQFDLWFNYFGEQYNVNSSKTYRKLRKKARNYIPNFLERGLALDISVDTVSLSDPEDDVLFLNAFGFPSGHKEPILEYYFNSRLLNFPKNVSSPYSVLVSLIRNCSLIKFSDVSMANDVLNEMTDSGIISGRKTVNPIDVEFLREKFSEFYLK